MNTVDRDLVSVNTSVSKLISTDIESLSEFYDDYAVICEISNSLFSIGGDLTHVFTFYLCFH